MGISGAQANLCEFYRLASAGVQYFPMAVLF